MNYYNEFDPYAAQWLRNLIAEGLIPAGDVDTRSITDVQPSDLAGYRQCHFFAGIGGWSLAARLAGWPDDRQLWTGSAPCQPFSVAGKGKAQADDRHLWPHLFRLARARRPAVLMGEQVAAAVGKDWIDGVFSDLEGIGYACGASVVPACAVDAPHRRDRLWFVAHADGARSASRIPAPAGRIEGLAGIADHGGGERLGSTGRSANCGPVADADLTSTSQEREQRGRKLGGAGGDKGPPGAPVEYAGCGRHGDADKALRAGRNAPLTDGGDRPWAGAGWLIGHDGKARRVGSDVRSVVDGLPVSLAGMCASTYAEAAEGVIEYAKAAKCGPSEVLRTVRDIVATEALWQEPRGFFGIREAEVLLPFLRELEGRIDQGWSQGEVQEDAGHGVRGMWIPARPACAPQGWGLHEQLAGEHSDALYALSRLLARAAGQAAASLLRDAGSISLLAHGVAGRVGKLRALGNAIVPAVAAEVIGAYMDCYPDPAEQLRAALATN